MQRGHSHQSFAVTREAHGEVPIVHVTGEIDLATVAAFERELMRAIATSERAILDLSDCTFIDSTGISAIIRANHLVRQRVDRRRGLSLVVRDPFVARIIERAGVDQVAQIHATVADAVSVNARDEGSPA